MRVIIPPTGNETISMLKTSSLASVVTLPEILFKAQGIYSQTFDAVKRSPLGPCTRIPSGPGVQPDHGIVSHRDPPGLRSLCSPGWHR